MNFYKHHLGDYAQATAHLSFVEDAAYSRLLRKYYAEERPIPGEIKAACRLVGARTKEEKEAVETILEEFFQLDAEDGVWRNKRADEEISRANAQAEINQRIAEEREARKRARLANDKSTNRSLTGNESLDDTCNDKSTNRQPSQTPDTRHQTKAESNAIEQRAARKTAERFPEFWTVYPVKKGRADAEAKWRAKGYDAIADQIIADVKRRMVEDRQWRDGFIPHGSTYVNGRGWEDAIEPVRGSSGSGGDVPDYLVGAL